MDSNSHGLLISGQSCHKEEIAARNLMVGEITVYEAPVPTITQTQSATGGIGFGTVAVVSFGMIFVRFVAGLIVLSRFAFPKKEAEPNERRR